MTAECIICCLRINRRKMPTPSWSPRCSARTVTELDRSFFRIKGDQLAVVRSDHDVLQYMAIAQLCCRKSSRPIRFRTNSKKPAKMDRQLKLAQTLIRDWSNAEFDFADAIKDSYREKVQRPIASKVKHNKVGCAQSGGTRTCDDQPDGRPQEKVSSRRRIQTIARHPRHEIRGPRSQLTVPCEPDE